LERPISHRPEAKFIWDPILIGICSEFSKLGVFPNVDRITYFTSCVGDTDKIHSVQVAIREAAIEPYVLQEDRGLSRQRENLLKESNVIEKAKGVDIGLAVRLLEDAYHNNFDWVYLFTSDVDYLPVIQAIRRLGKRVQVFGFKNGIATNSPLLHVPDEFIDLQPVIEKLWRPSTA
jgi:hypothetical protein